MSSFKDLQYQRQEKLIETSNIFNNDPAHGMYRGKERPFVFKMRKEGKAFPLGSTRLFSKASFRHTPFS